MKPDRKWKLCVITICIVKINYPTVTTLLSVSDGAFQHSILTFIFCFTAYCFTFTADKHVANDLLLWSIAEDILKLD